MPVRFTDYWYRYLYNFCNTNFRILLQDYLQSCLDQIEEMVNATMNDRNISCNTQPCSNSSVASSSTSSKAAERSASTSSPSAMDKMQEHGKAGTPTDVRDIHFWLKANSTKQFYLRGQTEEYDEPSKMRERDPCKH